MKKVIFLIALSFAITNVKAQSKSAPDVQYRVQKDYDEKGNLIRYDSSQVEIAPGIHRQFFYQFSSDSIGQNPTFFSMPHFISIDSLIDMAMPYSLKFNFIDITKEKSKWLDSLIKEHSELFKNERFFNDFEFEFPDEFENKMKNFDSLMKLRLDKLEKRFEHLESKFQNSKEKPKKAL